MGKKKDNDLSRRQFLKTGAAVGVGASAFTAVPANAQADREWEHEADFVTIGAGVSALAAAVSALSPTNNTIRATPHATETRGIWRGAGGRARSTIRERVGLVR